MRRLETSTQTLGILLGILTACSDAPTSSTAPSPEDTGTTSQSLDAPTLPSVPTTTSTTNSSTTSTDTRDWSVPTAEDLGVDCENLPSGPFTPEYLTGTISGEDIDFDGEGNLIGGWDHIIQYRTDGTSNILVPNLPRRAGTRRLPNGDLLTCDLYGGLLLRVSMAGDVQTLLTGLSLPNGVDVHPAGWALVAETGGRLFKIDPDTGESEAVVNDVSGLNGVAFSADYSEVYLSTESGSSEIYRASVSPDGEVGRPELFIRDAGSMLTGIGVDACGNIYTTQWNIGVVARLSAITGEREEILHLPNARNLQWGYGPGGWDEESLYIVNGVDEVVRLPIGVPTTKRY